MRRARAGGAPALQRIGSPAGCAVLSFAASAMSVSIISSEQPLESGSRQYSSISAAVCGWRGEGGGRVRGHSLYTRHAGGALTGAFLSPSLAKKAETPSIMPWRLSSNPMVTGPVRAELKEATVRGVCIGKTKALHERTEATTRKMRIIIARECVITIALCVGRMLTK